MRDLKLDFGAIGDGIADDTVAVQAALSWVASAMDDLFIPPGAYLVTSQLSVVHGTSFRVRGSSRPGASWITTLKWGGAPGGIFLLLDGCRESEWSDFAIDAGINAAIEPAVLVDIDKVTPGSWNSRLNSFRRMLLRGGSMATVRISQTTGVNNEANVFEDVGNFCVPGSQWNPVTGTGPVGYQVKHVNAKSQQIVRGDIGGKAIAVDVQDGSFHMQGTQIGGCGTWMRHAGRGEPCSMVACDGDSSRTFLETMPAQTAPFVGQANRFIQGQDGPLFSFGDCVGPITLIGNEFASGGYKTPAACFTAIAGNGPNLTAIGNAFPNDQVIQIPSQAPPKYRALVSLMNTHYNPGNQIAIGNNYMVGFRSNGNSSGAIQFGGTIGFRGEATPVAHPSHTINTNQPVIPLVPAFAMTMSSLPPLRPGIFEGQRVELLNVSSFGIGFIDQNTLPGTTLALVSPTVTIPPRGSMALAWTMSYGGRWIQVSPVVTPL